MKILALRLHELYNRPEVAEALGETFSGASWRQGVVRIQNGMILFATLEKSDLPTIYRYQDSFEKPHLFHWQSQNRDAHDRRRGTTYVNHEKLGLAIHLLVRPTRKKGGRARPFRYCGEVVYLDSKGDNPMNITWRLRDPVPSRLWEELQVDQ